MRPDNNEAFLRNFRLIDQQTETVTGTLWRWKTNIYGSYISCLPIWITHLAVRRNKLMLKLTGQFAGDRILIFRGDKVISVLLHPVVFSLRLNLDSIMAPSESALCEPLCAQQVWVSRLSQHSVS
jgi:hypothetical protein